VLGFPSADHILVHGHIANSLNMHFNSTWATKGNPASSKVPWWAKESQVFCRNADCANSYSWERKGQLSWAWHYTWAPILTQAKAMDSRASAQHVRPAVGFSWSWRVSSTIAVSATRACQVWRCHLCLTHGYLRCSQDVNRRTEAVLWWQHVHLTYTRSLVILLCEMKR